MNKKENFILFGLLFCCIGCAEKGELTDLSSKSLDHSSVYVQISDKKDLVTQAKEDVIDITPGGESNLCPDTSSVLIEFNEDEMVLHYAPTEKEIAQGLLNEDMHIYPNEITYTAIRNGLLFGYAHQDGAYSDFLITYDLSNKNFFINSDFEISRWPASNIFPNNVVGAINCVNNGNVNDKKALLFDNNCVLLKNQLQFDYGKDMEWIPKGIAFNQEKKTYILPFVHKETEELGIATFDENGKLLERFMIKNLFYPEQVGKGQSSVALYVCVLPLNNVLIGTHVLTPVDQWFAVVNLDDHSANILKKEQLESFFHDQKIRVVKSNLGWYILPEINHPPFSFQKNEEEIAIYLSEFTPVISIPSKYMTLWDWEPIKENYFYALFLNTDAIGFT